MKLALMYGRESDEHQYLLDAFKKYFDTVAGIPVDGVRINYSDGDSNIYYDSSNICDFDAVFLRLFGSDMKIGEEIIETLLDNNVYTQMDEDSFFIASNKFYSMLTLSEVGVSVPDSIYALSTEQTTKGAENLDYPVVIKIISGYGGKGIMKAGGKKELKPITDVLGTLEQNACIQEFIENPGEDVRIMVIGDETYSYKRVGNPGEWRSNISSGGERKKYNPPEEVKNIAIKAAKSCGFDFCGVDIIESEEGPKVAEINASPGLGPKDSEAMETDIPDKVAKFFKERVMDKKSKLDKD